MSELREIPVQTVIDAVARLCVEANRHLTTDLSDKLKEFYDRESKPLAKDVLGDMLENIRLAGERNLPVCQDTGMAVVFVDIGQDVHFVGGDFEAAVHEGVRRGYRDGYLRCSVVGDPLNRVNTGDNTPAVLHTRMVPGNRVKITVAPKGFGSENMSAVRMLTPAAGREDVVAEVVRIVKAAGSNPCPPMVLGVGLGGDFELCALLAKKALLRPLHERHPDPFYARLEEDILTAVNASGIGPQGFGGDTTALSAAVEIHPTHIAGLPLAVNVGCYVNRHAETVL